MGQDSYVDTGAYVKVELTFENLAILQELMDDVENELIEGYVHFDGIGCGDEVSNLQRVVGGDEVIAGINTVTSEDDLHTFIKEHELSDVPFIYFLYGFTRAYARNISRRDHPHIFDEGCDTSIDVIIDRCKSAKKYFLDRGFNEEQVSIGSSFDLDC